MFTHSGVPRWISYWSKKQLILVHALECRDVLSSDYQIRSNLKVNHGVFFVIAEWRPADDPVLSGVTQTCVTKLEGEVLLNQGLKKINFITHLMFKM